MNAKDRVRLSRLYAVLDGVPRPATGGGTQSQSISGVAGYAEDMNEFLPAVRELVTSISLDGHTSYEPWGDYIPADKMLDAIESWLGERRRTNWSRPTPLLQRPTEGR